MHKSAQFFILLCGLMKKLFVEKLISLFHLKQKINNFEKILIIIFWTRKFVAHEKVVHNVHSTSTMLRLKMNKERKKHEKN